MRNNLSFTLVVVAVLSFLTSNTVQAQSDGCSFATNIAVGAIGSCTLTHGTTVGATQTIPGCSGTADDDVWYQFTATSTSMKIEVQGNAGFDPVLQVFSGPCSVLQSQGCIDNTALGGTETYSATNFAIGSTYRVRVYSWGSGASAEGDFDICVSEAATPPSNDDCAGATNLNVNASCSFQTFDNSGATQSMPGCAGTADDDVWFKFTATNAVQTITVDPSSVGTGLMDPVVELFQGSCSSLTQISCNDNTGVGQAETVNAVGLIPGQTYYFRVYDYYSNWYDSFNVCVVGTPTPAPTNDDVCNAINLPTVTSACEYLTFNNVGATPSVGPPNPYIMSSSCETGSSTGYNPSSTGDVWFAITVPASGDLYITAQPNIGAGAMSDGAMVLYTGSCSSPGSLTQVAYSNDYSCYPNSSPISPYMPFMPFISATGLTPGSTVYLRYYNWGTSSPGTFGICVSTAENDDCSNALYICDINGYKGSTGTYYTADRPDNMHGNNETSAGVNQPDGTNTGGPFGFYPPSNIPGPYSSPNIDVVIDNNSWIRFTASASTVVLNVDVYDCFKASAGIQMQIFSSNGCTNFTPVSSFEENNTGFTITANGLTVGQDYMLMIDGFGGDICSYTISANTGVQFPDIPDPAPVCSGDPVTLTAPASATSYKWDNGATTQSITIYPGTSGDVSCVVTGLCDHKQTLTAHVTVKPSPVLSFSTGSNPTICSGDPLTITAAGADTYSWNTTPTQTGSTINVSPTSNHSYTVTGMTSGCTATKTINVHVNPSPTISLSAPNSTICDGTNVTISASSSTSGLTYTWDNGLGSGNSKTVSPSTSTTYHVTGTDGNGCADSKSIAITVTPLPTVTTGANKTICNGESVNLSASGASSYSWNHGAGNSANPSVNPSSTTTYTVTGTTNGCSNTATQKVTVHDLPTLTVASSTDPAACGQDGTIHLTFTHVSNGTYTIHYGSGSFTNVTVYGASATINAPAGTYNDLYITNSYGCTSTALPDVSLSDPSAPNTDASVAQNTVCSGDDIHLSATTVPGATYTWAGPNGYTSNQQNPTINGAGTSANGTYYLTVTQAGCTGNDNVAVTVNPRPTLSLNATDSTICKGESTTLSASGATSYTWDNGIGNGASPTVSPTTTTTYIVTATDNNGCVGKDSITINVNQLPSVTATAGSFCKGDTAKLSATAAVSYAWAGPDNFVSSIQNPFVPDFSSSNAGIYTLTVTDQNGCKNSDTAKLSLEVLSGLNVTASDNEVCLGKDIELTATGADTYAWTGPNGFSSTGDHVHLTDMDADKAGTYYVMGTNAADCSASDTIVVGVEISGECLFIPELVTPNSDHKNDKWIITGIEAFPKAEVNIFNRWGNIVFHASPYKNNWKGQVNKGLDVGKGLLPSGTYFYVIKFNNGKDKDIKGYIELQY